MASICAVFAVSSLLPTLALFRATIVVSNPLTQLTELSCALNVGFSSTDNSVAFTIVKGSVSDLSALPARWLAEADRECVYRAVYLPLTATVVACCVWELIGAGIMLKLATAGGASGLWHPWALKGRLLLGIISPCCFVVALADSALQFLARTCIKRTLNDLLTMDSLRTKFSYVVTVSSWPAFLLLFVTAASFMRAVLLFHWVLWDEFGGKIRRAAPHHSKNKADGTELKHADADEDFFDIHTTVPAASSRFGSQASATRVSA